MGVWEMKEGLSFIEEVRFYLSEKKKTPTLGVEKSLRQNSHPAPSSFHELT